MRRRTNRSKRKKQKYIIIITSLSLILFLAVGYAAFNTNLSITAKGNIKDKSRIIQSWTSTDQTDFHSDYYKENIVSATFLDTNDVPSNATESWNVSEDKTHGGVMAWVVPNNEDNTKYDLYIGAKNGVVANEDSSWLFYKFSGVKEIEFGENFDTSNVTNMASIFNRCIELLELDVSSFDTRKVTNMEYMFASSIAALPMKIETILLGENFKTNNVINMHAMFGNCNNLKNVDVSDFNTSNVIDMHDMFSSCHSLTNIDVSNWDTSKVTNMFGMFFSCLSITELNLCSFNTENVKNMQKMFLNTPILKTIKVGPNWTTANADTTNMFSDSGVSEVTYGQC